VNAGVGAELFVAERLSLLGGVQTDVNALPELDAVSEETRLARVRASYYRAGVGLSSYTDFGDLVFGVRFDYGKGEAAGVNAFTAPPSRAIIDYSEFGVLVVLAGSITWSSVRQTAEDVEDVVDGEAPPPAQAPREPMRKPVP
jgi:hypothetical protein